jgi:hypothetical protein
MRGRERRRARGYVVEALEEICVQSWLSTFIHAMSMLDDQHAG